MLLAMSTSLMAQNNCLDFDGTDDYVAANGVSSYVDEDDFTIECWFNVNDATPPDYEAIWTFNDWNGDNRIEFGVYDGKLYIYYIPGSTVGGSSTLSSNTWYHTAVTLSNSNGTLRVYLNGIVDITTSTTERVVSDDLFSLGQEWDNLVPSGFFSGQLDDVHIWDTVRGVSQIQADMYIAFTGNQTGLVASYNFNFATETTLTDQTTNGLNGTLVNMDDNDWVLTAFYGGSGTSEDAFTVDNLNELRYLSGHSADWGSYFTQTTNIDASATTGWDDGAGFSPIGSGTGTYFTGNYDGQGHTISGIYQSRYYSSGTIWFTA